ncbi:hypothetical protein PINS_up014160 [Pythium insidiosum]|nr:hypothetical protein PINS_up014160 [Pythium insidiosum]
MTTPTASAAAAPEPAATVQGKVTGLIYPPPDIRAIVDKTAQFVARNGRSFERKIAGETMSARFSFLRESDPYHAYYEHKVTEFTEQHAAEAAAKPTADDAGAAKDPKPAAENERSAPPPPPPPSKQQVTASAEDADAAPTAKEEPVSGDVVVEKKAVEAVTAKVAKKIREKALTPPQEEKFVIKHPHLSALDQEIMYVTAQYTAVSGKAFLAGLATREQRNPQFDFLKPTHPLFAYFTALVESYATVLAKTEEQMKRYVHLRRRASNVCGGLALTRPLSFGLSG